MKTHGIGFALGCMAVALLAAAAVQAQVVATPGAVTFHHAEDSKTIQLTHDGQPVPASAIRGVQFLVGQSDYSRQISVERRDGAVVVVPDKTEVGWYQLVVNTDFGAAVVTVYAPLAHGAETLEDRARAMGISAAELRERMGTRPLREEIDLVLPPVAYVGQTLIVDAPPAAEGVHVWRIDGRVVQEGREAERFTYTPMEPGEFVLSYARQVGGEIVVSDTASTRVVDQPPVHQAIRPNTRLRLRSPEGYAAHSWTLDGDPVGSEAVLEHVFAKPGTYTVVNEAREPLSETVAPFRRITYRVAVEAPGP